MKQLLQNLRSGETLIAEVPIPSPQRGQVLVQTAASLVSAGTERTLVAFAEKSLLGKARSRPDLVRRVISKARRDGLIPTIEATFNRLEQPMPLGYSSAGTVAAMGEGVSGFQIGQRVACAGGGYAVHAEFAIVPYNLVVPLPDEVDFESGAFSTIGAIAMHGFRLSEAALGERVAVIGLGLMGMLCGAIAHAAGCQVLGIDLDPRRVEMGIKMGAQPVLRTQAEAAAQSFSQGRGCDAILICADTPSSDPVELAGAIARDRARVVAVGAVGLQLPRKIYYEKELTFINSRSYGPGRYDPAYEEGGQDYPIGYVRWTEGRNMQAFIELLAKGLIDVSTLITHRFSIDQAPKAYDLITRKGEQPFLGVLLKYPQELSGQFNDGGSKSKELKQNKLLPTLNLNPSSVKLGILGAGNFATNVLLPAIHSLPGLELIGVASASGLSARHAAVRYKFQYAAGNEEQILNDENINTVAVLTRHHLHARQVKLALEAGKHVFCEKPLALNEAELQEITQALEAYAPSSPAPLLTAGFNRRFAPLAKQLHEFLQDRKEPILAHYRVNAGYIPSSHWVQDRNQGGGRIIGEACHFIDFLTFLAGQPPFSVSAQALADSGRYQEDNAILTFRFPDGSLGTVSYTANGDNSFPKERLEVFCGGKVAVLDDFRSLETTWNGKRQVIRSRLRQDKGHQAEWGSFIIAILSSGPPPIPYEHLFGVTRASFAALESIRKGGEVEVIG